MSAFTPGPQKDGRILMDCADDPCWVNTLIQYRCPLHASAPALLAALEAIAIYVDDDGRFMPDDPVRDLLTDARHAIAQARSKS